MDNKQMYYFTFNLEHPLSRGYQPILASSYGAARRKMFDVYGDRWCFQYTQEAWEAQGCKRWYPESQALDILEAE